jgi:anthranilate phosphoribosyltransferase
MKEFIKKISEGHHLTREEAQSAMRTIMEGGATEAQIAAFLLGLKVKGEQAEELLGFVEVMREKSVKVNIDDTNAIDMCGTGGDGSGTFNISTVASFVVAGAGVTVAKHGNRSISSSCGSADVLKALGVNIELAPEKAAACINKIGIGFLFAPLFHPAMKYAAKPRSELGVKTCFNMLGPMTNPAGVRRQLVGTFSHDAAKKIADVFSLLDAEKVFVIHSEDGLDEISLEAPTVVHEVTSGFTTTTFHLQPTQFELSSVENSKILGGTAEENAQIAMNVLEGNKGPYRDVVLANAAFGLLVSGKARTIQEGVHLASESIDSGNALNKLTQLKEFSNK